MSQHSIKTGQMGKSRTFGLEGSGKGRTAHPMSAVVFIPLTQGKVTVIDFDDFEQVRPYKWFALASSRSKTFYAVRHEPKNHF